MGGSEGGLASLVLKKCFQGEGATVQVIVNF